MKLKLRRREVEEYMRTSDDIEFMRELAEANMEHAAELLQRAEREGTQN